MRKKKLIFMMKPEVPIVFFICFKDFCGHRELCRGLSRTSRTEALTPGVWEDLNDKTFPINISSSQRNTFLADIRIYPEA